MLNIGQVEVDRIAQVSDVDTLYEATDSSGLSSPVGSLSEAGDSLAADVNTEEHIMNAHNAYKKVLVTGGAGFIGSSLARELLLRGDDVVIVDEVNDYYDVNVKRGNLRRLVAEFGTERCRVYEGDICDVPFITNVFETERPRWIAHMAARAGVRPSIQDPFIYIHSNIEGTTRLLELAHRFGCDNFVFASSSSVYGEGSKEVFSETDVVDFPVSPYAASKKACELIGYTYHHLYKLNVTGLRFFTVYGPRGRPDMAPYKFIDRVVRGVEIEQYGTGNTSRDYTYISDIVDGIVRAIDRPLGYQIFNLGRGSPTSLSRFINIVEECVGKKAIIKICPEQPGDVPRTCADVSKARRMLGYEAKVSFEEGIRKTVEWYVSEIASVGAEGSNHFRKELHSCASTASLESLEEEEGRVRAFTDAPSKLLTARRSHNNIHDELERRRRASTSVYRY